MGAEGWQCWHPIREVIFLHLFFQDIQLQYSKRMRTFTNFGLPSGTRSVDLNAYCTSRDGGSYLEATTYNSLHRHIWIWARRFEGRPSSMTLPILGKSSNRDLNVSTRATADVTYPPPPRVHLARSPCGSHRYTPLPQSLIHFTEALLNHHRHHPPRWVRYIVWKYGQVVRPRPLSRESLHVL